ncbi:MAG TPA: ATP-dependent zinc metalloprotease FtsH [Candidatus Onthousia faecigallinarum]|nr:ATP-dependent zinc metalloprotease FtsH [Candidatus Onthousia faecigallinarum]
MNKKTVKKGLLPYVFLLLIIIGVFYFVSIGNQQVNVLTYDEFMNALDTSEITELEVTPRDRAKVYEITGKLKDYEPNESFFVRVPLSEQVMKRLVDASEVQDFEFEATTDPESNSFLLILVNILPIIILGGFAFWFLSKQMGGGKNSFDFGKSKAKLSSDKHKVTFKDVAGLKEEKEEVKELIDFLKNPKKFQKLGARIPKGVLLYGPPGTGKTLLARAVAGEANVPFYYISGSDFVELFVGVGASRVRDMFQQAKRTAPCLIFIDEIDAVGRQRGTGLGGGHDEREQTLNQLLTEMDGFGENEGIIIIAATNRPDVLDPALLRPGRFDRQIMVNLPDVKGREEILAVHARNKVLAPNVKLSTIAKRTPGYSGADLENLLNEAALLAVRRNKDAITMSEIDEASDRVLMGPAKSSANRSESDRKLVAYHESGHAVVGIKLKGASDVQKVTIIPRGSAGGYNMMIPSEEKICSTKTDLLEQITGLLAGRVAEEVVFHEVTTGAENDFAKATKIARSMVTEYGMSDLGPMQLEQQEGSVFLGRDYNKTRNFSNEVAHEIDTEMRKIIEECYEHATKIIKENRKLLDLLATNLLEYETLTKEQIDYLVEHGKMPPEEEETTYEKMSITRLKEIAKEKGIKGYSKMNKAELLKALEGEK